MTLLGSCCQVWENNFLCVVYAAVLPHLNFSCNICSETNGQNITVLELFMNGFILKTSRWNIQFSFFLNFRRYKIVDAFKTFLQTVYKRLVFRNQILDARQEIGVLHLLEAKHTYSLDS
jgi:hypothetical protein